MKEHCGTHYQLEAMTKARGRRLLLGRQSNLAYIFAYKKQSYSGAGISEYGASTRLLFPEQSGSMRKKGVAPSLLNTCRR